MRRASLAAALVLIAACQPGGPERAGEAAAVAASEITVTPLEPTGTAGTGAAEAPRPPDPGPPEPAPVAPEPVPDPVPEPAKTPQQLACERGGGRYVAASDSGARACVRPTRDAGKRCTRERDCDGLCLARSQTCAPIKPLFGCNDILQDDGRRVTLCVD
jgi:hypothetical protein